MTRILVLILAALLFPLSSHAQTPCQGHWGSYPLVTGGCLDAADFNNLAELSIGPAPPQNAFGQGARKGKRWLDTSVAPAIVRMCTIASPGNCQTQYVQAEWIDQEVIDFGTSVVNWPIGGGAVTVPSSAVVDLGHFPQAVVTISGNVTITSFGTSLPVGRAKWVTFTGTPLLVNSANLILPGGSNITAQAGDSAAVLSVPGGKTQVLYQPARTAAAIPSQQNITTGGTSPVTISNGDVLVNVNAAVTLTLPASGPIRVWDVGGFVPAHPITIVPPSGNISGSPSWVIANRFGSATFTPDGTNYKAQDNTQTASVANNTALKLLPSTQYQAVTRLGVTTPGDSDAMLYTSSNSACSLNSGNGDDVSQVKSSDSKCWLAGISVISHAVANNAALLALKSTQFPAVTRLGFSASGDGGGANYISSNSACSLNSGNGDNGSQVKSADNKCWLISVPGNAMSVSLFGAIGDGVADDTAAIQAAQAAADAAGKEVFLPTGNYKISSTLFIGNGSSSAASTTKGNVWRGQGPAGGLPVFGAVAPIPSARLSWAGGAAPVVSVRGPLAGWGISNLAIDCNSVAGSTGLLVTSAQYGHSDGSVSIDNCQFGADSTTLATFPGGITNADSYHNVFNVLSIKTADINGSYGVRLGNGGVGADTDFWTITDLTVAMPGTGGHTIYGVYFKNCDDNLIANYHTYGVGIAVGYDYTASTGVWPAGNTISHMDGGTLSIVNVGSPANASVVNYVNNMSLTNSGVFPVLPGLIVDHAYGLWSPVLRGTSGTPTYSPTPVGTYEMNGWSVTVNFNLQTTSLNALAGSSIGVGGLPIAAATITNNIVGCSIAGTGVTLDSGYTQLTAKIGSGNTWIDLGEFGSTKTTVGTIPVGNLAAATGLYGSCTYPRS